MPGGVGYQDMGGRVMRYPLRRIEKPEPGVHRDVSLTRRWMDAMGVDIAVLFPSPMLQLGLHPQVEVEVALAPPITAGSPSACWPRSRASAR